MLAVTHGIAPLPEDFVVDLSAQAADRRLHVRVHQLDLRDEIPEHVLHGRIQIGHVFLHGAEQILRAQVGRGHDGQRRFQFGGDIFLVVAGRELHIPEGQEQEAHRHDRGQKVIPDQDGDGATHHEQKERGRADEGEAAAPARHGEDVLRLRDGTPEHAGLFSSGGFVNLVADALFAVKQETEQAVREFHRL